MVFFGQLPGYDCGSRITELCLKRFWPWMQIFPRMNMTRSISEDEIHLWKFQVNQVNSTNWNVLSSDERIRAKKFRFQKLREKYACCRSTLRILLSEYTGMDPQDIRFDYGPAGKPAMIAEQGSKLQFNLSHSGNWCIVGITRIGPTGVDVEQVRDLPDLPGMAKQILSNNELTQFCRLPRENQQDAYFGCWTQKESILKCLGSGFSLPVRTIEVQVDPRKKPQLINTGDGLKNIRLTLRRIDVARGYRACLAIESTSSNIELMELDYEKTSKAAPQGVV